MHGEVTGIEISGGGDSQRQRTVAEQGLEGVKFAAGDATEFAVNARETPEMLVVNPPRRGIGERLCAWG